MLMSFSILIFGFLTALRILDEVIGQNILSRKQMTKFGTAYFLICIALSFFTHDYFVLWAICFAPHFIFSIFILLLKHMRRKKFEEHFEEILNMIILKMKSQKSFRNSFSEVITESATSTQRILIDIRDVVVFSQQNKSIILSAFTQKIILEFVLADQAPHAALKRLIQFRDRLKIQTDFRRKSGQVLQQIRAQSFILTAIYLALLVFVLKRFGFETNQRIIFLSLSFFIIGLGVIFYGGHKLKWKI